MVDFSRLRARVQGLQKGINAIGPYVLGNIGAAAALDSGVRAFDIGPSLENVLFYGGLGLFNAGVLVPSVRMGLGNYVGTLFEREGVPSSPLHPHVKTALLGGTLAFCLSSDAVREGSIDAYDRIFGNEEEPSLQPPSEGPQEGTGLIISHRDSTLEASIQKYVDNLRAQGFARSRGVENYALYAKDLRSEDVFVDINSDRQQLAASTAKLFLLGAALAELDSGELAHTDRRLRKKLETMICRSSNSATNFVLETVGKDDVRAYLQEYGYDQTVVDFIPKDGRTLTNLTSARNLGDFLEGVYRGTLPNAEEIARILALKCEGHDDRLVDQTCIPDSPHDLQLTGGYVERVLDKTGFIQGANGNAGLVYAHFYNSRNGEIEVPYLFVALIEDRNVKEDGFRKIKWGHAKTETIRSISESGYWYLHDFYSDKDHTCRAHNGRHPK